MARRINRGRKARKIFFLGGYRASLIPFVFAFVGVLSWVPSTGCSVGDRDVEEVSQGLESTADYLDDASEVIQKFGEALEEVTK